jgi:hypothetical protein
MAGSFWRLLAAFLLILLAALLHAQGAGAGHIPLPAIVPRYASASADSMLGLSGPSMPSPSPLVGRHPYGFGPDGLLQIAHPAGIIFSGTVTAVSPPSAKKSHATTITFKVNHAIRGASAGETLTIREWSGLWRRGERYHVGECVFLFLYSPSRLGLTSPVAGGAGRFAVNFQGKILLSPQHIQMFAGDPILGGKVLASYSDFARAVQHAGLE